MYLPDDLRRLLDEADDGRCAYCQTAVANTGQPLTTDHVIPRVLGGTTAFVNLCYACRRCNEFKGAAISAVDPLTGIEATLFHPRRDRWREHFAWGDTTAVDDRVGVSDDSWHAALLVFVRTGIVGDSRTIWG